MSESSSSRHNLGHDYAVPGDKFPGSLGPGATAQSIGRPEQPEILAQANVGAPVVKPGRKRTRRTAR